MALVSSIIKIINKYSSLFLIGLERTLILALVGTICGLLIGLLIGGIRVIALSHEPRESKIVRFFKKILAFLTYIYITIIRGTPMMVQAMMVYYPLLPILRWTPMVAGCVIISFNTGAYMAEIIRSGIQSVDKGQTEAARSIGMTSWQTMIYIVLPQAIKNSFPAIGNELIVNIKDSSVLSCITIAELFLQAKTIAGSTFSYLEPYLIVALMYLFLTSFAAFVMGKIEQRISHTKSSYGASQTTQEAIAAVPVEMTDEERGY